MASRPRRSAAAKARDSITVQTKLADSDDKNHDNCRMSARKTNRAASPGSDSHLDVTIKVPADKLRQATGSSNRRDASASWAAFRGDQIVHGKRDRGGKKNYAIDSDDEDNEEEEEDEEDEDVQPEEEDDEDDEDMVMEDADVDETTMNMGRESEDEDEEEDEDAEGDIGMDSTPKSKAQTSKSIRATALARPRHHNVIPDDDDDDDELSDPDSDINEQTMGFGDETVMDEEEEDAEGEEVEEMEPAVDAGDADSDEEDEGEPDLAKMTKRQRARFEDGPQEFMKLSDEVQAKKVFTAEELSMRRQEMARRRRNLSEKRNEEVKMETINKLLKKQAPKVNKKALAAAAAAEAAPEYESSKVNPIFIRWTSNKDGVSVAVPDAILQGPAGKVFHTGRGFKHLGPKKMVQEVE